MLIYLGAWTFSDTPDAEIIVDNEELKFKQCVYNWWDHSLAIGNKYCVHSCLLTTEISDILVPRHFAKSSHIHAIISLV